MSVTFIHSPNSHNSAISVAPIGDGGVEAPRSSEPLGPLQNSCRVRPLPYIVRVHRVRLADRSRGWADGPLFVLTSCFGGRASGKVPPGCHSYGGNAG